MADQDQRIQLLLSIQADLAVLKTVLVQMSDLGAVARKSAEEANQLGVALKNATEGHARDIQALNAEIAKLRTVSTAASVAAGKLAAENTALTQTTTKLGTENSKMALQMEGAKNSIAALQAEQRRLATEIERLRSHLGGATTGLLKLADAQKASSDTAKQNAQSQKAQSDAADGAGASFVGLQAILASGVTIAAVRMGSALVDANLEIQRVRQTLLASQGSAVAAGNAYAFVSNEADRLGLSMDGVLSPFGSFSIAAKTSGLSVDEARQIFTQYSEAGSVMALSADSMKGIFLALSQMLSKGTVQAEELRGQLGERLPGAFELSAKAMGVSTQQLGKMLEQGQVLSKDLLPKLGAELQRQFGQYVPDAAKMMQSEINRLDKALLDFKTTINEAGFAEQFTDTIRDLTGLLKELGQYARENPEEIRSMGRALAAIGIGVFTAGLAASTAALALWAATASTAAVAATALALSIGAVVAAGALSAITVTRAIEAYGEMREAQIDLEGSNGRINADLIKQVGAMQSAADAATARRQALTQLAAAEKAYNDATKPTKSGRGFQQGRSNEDSADAIAAREQMERMRSIIALIDNRSTAIIDGNQLEAARTEELRAQTAELEKQKSEVAKLVAAAGKATPESNRKYDKAYLSTLVTPEEKVAHLQGRLDGVNTQMATPLGTGGAQTPEEIKNAFIALEQRDKALLIEKVELEKQIADIKREQIDAENKAFEVGRKELEDQIKKGNELYMQAEEKKRQIRLYQEEQSLSQKLASSQSVIQQISNSDFLTHQEKARITNQLLREQNTLIGERITLLDERQKSNYDPTRQGQIDSLRQQGANNDATMADNAPMTIGGGATAGLVDYLDSVPDAAERARQSVLGIAQAMEQGIATSLRGLIDGTMTWGDALANIANSVINAVIGAFVNMAAQWIVQQLVMAVAGKAIQAAQVAAIAPLAAATALIWTPAATAASIATFGGAAVTGAMMAKTAILTSAVGFSDGGYTGDGAKNEPAGIVHKGEVVFSQADVSRLGGVSAVESIRVGGGGVPVGGSASASPAVKASGVMTGESGGTNISLAMFDGRMSAEKWAASAEGERHIVNVVQRNIHKITGRS